MLDNGMTYTIIAEQPVDGTATQSDTIGVGTQLQVEFFGETYVDKHYLEGEIAKVFKLERVGQSGEYYVGKLPHTGAERPLHLIESELLAYFTETWQDAPKPFTVSHGLYRLQSNQGQTVDDVLITEILPTRSMELMSYFRQTYPPTDSELSKEAIRFIWTQALTYLELVELGIDKGYYTDDHNKSNVLHYHAIDERLLVLDWNGAKLIETTPNYQSIILKNMAQSWYRMITGRTPTASVGELFDKRMWGAMSMFGRYFIRSIYLGLNNINTIDRAKSTINEMLGWLDNVNDLAEKLRFTVSYDSNISMTNIEQFAQRNELEEITVKLDFIRRFATNSLQPHAQDVFDKIETYYTSSNEPFPNDVGALRELLDRGTDLNNWYRATLNSIFTLDSEYKFQQNRFAFEQLIGLFNQLRLRPQVILDLGEHIDTIAQKLDDFAERYYNLIGTELNKQPFEKAINSLRQFHGLHQALHKGDKNEAQQQIDKLKTLSATESQFISNERDFNLYLDHLSEAIKQIDGSAEDIIDPHEERERLKQWFLDGLTNITNRSSDYQQALLELQNDLESRVLSVYASDAYRRISREFFEYIEMCLQLTYPGVLQTYQERLAQFHQDFYVIYDADIRGEIAKWFVTTRFFNLLHTDYAQKKVDTIRTISPLELADLQKTVERLKHIKEASRE